MGTTASYLCWHWRIVVVVAASREASLRRSHWCGRYCSGTEFGWWSYGSLVLCSRCCIMQSRNFRSSRSAQRKKIQWWQSQRLQGSFISIFRVIWSPFCCRLCSTIRSLNLMQFSVILIMFMNRLWGYHTRSRCATIETAGVVALA